MITEKEDFLKKDFIPLLQKLKATDKGAWGIMSPQQMVEHFAESIKIASGKSEVPALIEGEKLANYRTFLMSETPFKENTNNPLLPIEGSPLQFPDLPSAINHLQTELDHFFLVFKNNPSLKTRNAFFGHLDYYMNIQLLHKHALHHLRQFNLV